MFRESYSFYRYFIAVPFLRTGSFGSWFCFDRDYQASLNMKALTMSDPVSKKCHLYVNVTVSWSDATGLPCRVLENPGKSWNLQKEIPGPGKSLNLGCGS